MSALEFVGLFFTVIGAVFWLLWLWPKISVRPGIVPDTKNILSTIFEISNEGNVAIYKIQPSYSFAELETFDGLKIIGDKKYSNRIVEPNTQVNKIVDHLNAGEKSSTNFPLSFNVGSNIKRVDLVVVINFKYLFFGFEKKFRFVSTQMADDSLVYKAEAVCK